MEQQGLAGTVFGAIRLLRRALQWQEVAEETWQKVPKDARWLWALPAAVAVGAVGVTIRLAACKRAAG